MAGDNDDDTLAVYFKCLRGANVHFALMEPDSFALQDEIGRDWICYPVPPDAVQQLDMLSDLAEIECADRKSGDETDMRLVFCQDFSELSRKLVEKWSA